MSMLICCTGCHTPLQLPPGTTAFYCIFCRSIGNTASPRSAPMLFPPVPPTTSSYCPGCRIPLQLPPGTIGDTASPRSAPLLYPPTTSSYCPGCRIPLQLPPGTTAFRCISCYSIGHTASPCSSAPILYPPTTSSYCNNNYHGQKKAVIIGILYKNQEKELRGCINDANSMKEMLIHRFNFTESSIFMLTDEETDPLKIPTKHNIMDAMSSLVKDCKSGDSLVFYFSGHGGQQPNTTGDEIDNQDETLLPLDHKTQGPIVDNDINDIIVKPLPAGVKLHAIIDACHSGTVLDLPYLCKMERSGWYSWEDHSPKSGAWKGTSGGKVISISGCADDQYSDDTNALSKAKMPAGAMTYAFIQAIQNGQSATYGSILNAMRYTISTRDEPGVVGRKQEPQLTSDHQFNVYTEPFSL